MEKAIKFFKAMWGIKTKADLLEENKKLKDERSEQFAEVFGKLEEYSQKVQDRDKEIDSLKEENQLLKVSNSPAWVNMEELRIELGSGLAELGKQLITGVDSCRRQIYQATGVVIPSVRVVDDMSLPFSEYKIVINDRVHETFEIDPTKVYLLVSDESEIKDGDEVIEEPAHGLKMIVTTEDEAREQDKLYYVDAVSVLTSHLVRMAHEHLSEIFTYGTLVRTLDIMAKQSSHSTMVDWIKVDSIKMFKLRETCLMFINRKRKMSAFHLIVQNIWENKPYTQQQVDVFPKWEGEENGS